MKKILMFILLLTVSTSASIAQETIGFSDPTATYHLDNYRLPTWQYNLLFLDFDGSYNTITQFNDAVNRSTFGRVAPAYRFYRESEAMIIEGFAELPLSTNRLFQEAPNGNESTDNTFQARLNAAGDAKYYIDDQLFGLGQAAITVNTSRRTTDGDMQLENIRRTADSRFLVAAGAGFGRVRNVTPVIRALRFNERLNALGTGNLTDSQIQDVAGIFSKRNGYGWVYDRPDRHFWNDVSNAVPGLVDNLTFFDAYYLSEAMVEATGQRFQGWDVAAMAFLDHYRFSEKRETDGTTTLDTDQSHSQVGLNLAGRFFHNISLEQMVSVRANLGFGRFIPDEGDSENLLLAGIELGHLYNITDRILVQSAITTEFDRVGSGDDAFSERIFRISSALTYFIEDNMNVTATIAYRSDKEEFGNIDRTRSEFGFNVSLRYYFFRAMN
jgi:hypothetical protein